MDNLPELHTYKKLMIHWGILFIDQVVKKSRNTLYNTLVQDTNMEDIMTITKRAAWRMIQLWIYKTLETMKIG